MVSQQRRRPDRRVVPERARIMINGFVDERVDDSGHRPRASTPVSDSQAEHGVRNVFSTKQRHPLIHDLTADPKSGRYVRDSFALANPQQRLRASQGCCVVSMRHQILQHATVGCHEFETVHNQVPPRRLSGTWKILSRNFL
jgi:hypothetical protein